ncbi:unnamed protein product [Nippostrongylus brasiliensis]|uniref:Protein SHQ1 homolog n=1 Tax=Nippostrongylus brasiliensis TaxID=27835 RepID=A0A0N4YVV1_NIPBR|nr:unnamed protein product [Nippostrongylus brasiliensis]
MCSRAFRTVEKDSKVLSYGDVVLYESDLQTLNPGCWLNDNIISFCCEYLLSRCSAEVKNQVAIVSAATCELIRYSGDVEIIREVFTSHGFFSKEKLVNTVAPFLDNREPSFRVYNCPQQQNSNDCGMYVIEFVRRELQLSEKKDVLTDIDSRYIELERRRWQDIILSLSKSDHMITPSFSIVQDPKWLIFIIRAPYAKIADTEIEYGDDIFMFSAPPYYLRVHLPREVVDDNTGTAKYDSSLGIFVLSISEFTVRVPKKNVGENFPGLDMICELLNPQKKISAKMLVEELRDSDEGEAEDDSEYYTEQNVVDIGAGCSENCTDSYGLSPEEQRLVALSLVDIVFAFAYDSRINDWETCCETGWNVTKLSPTLVFLCQWSSAKEVV